MNTIKQAKHLNDNILGRYGTLRVHRTGVSQDGTYTWTAEIGLNGKIYEGWGTSEEEARTNAAQAYKEGKWSLDTSGRTPMRYDASKLVTAVQISENNWWRVVQKPIEDLVQKDEKSKQFVVRIDLPEPIKNIVLLAEILKIANQKTAEASVSYAQLEEEFAKRLYPILSYSGLWNDNLSKEELDDFYGVEHVEESI